MNMNAGIDNELELDILNHIRQSPGGVRQRDLATVIGKSLGMTNAILHRLTEKGMLTVAKVNNRNISYAVTPRGMRELAGRSYRYFKRTIRNVVDYKDAIERELCLQLQAMAAVLPADRPRSLVLVGRSDLEFILEHLAHKYGLGWTVLPGGQPLAAIPLDPGVVLMYSEDSEKPVEALGRSSVVFLRDII